jgi:hypothetical protein
LSFEAEAPPRVKNEADFGLLWKESIFGEEKTGVAFGECKTYGEFQTKDFDRMRYKEPFLAQSWSSIPCEYA